MNGQVIHFPRRQLTGPPRCAGCPYRSRTCGPKGPVDSPFVIVGEGPGSKEIIAGLPFVGPSGEVLDKALAGYTGPAPYITNSCLCLPINKDLDNLAEAVNACRERLFNEISAHPREVILALGNAAVWSLTGDTTSKISYTRGRIFPSPLARRGIVACIHPAALMRGFGSSRLFKRDIKLACDLVTGDSPYQYKECETVLMETEGDIRNLLDEASTQPYAAADLETTGFSPRLDYILSHGFCWDARKAYIVPPHLAHLIGPIYNPNEIPIRLIWHNGKFDVGMLRGSFNREHSNWRQPAFQQYIRHSVATIGNRWGWQFARTDEDTMLLNYCLDEVQGIHGLEVVANDILGAPNWKNEIKRWLPKKKASYANIPPEVLYLYQGKDLGNTWQIFWALRPLVERDPKLAALYRSHLLPASEELTHLEGNGFPMDEEWVNKNKTNYGWQSAIAYIEFDQLAQKTLGTSVNPNSWQQVQKLLYKGGLDIANGRILATDKDTLRAFPNAPGVKELQRVRKLRKLISTYIDGIFDAREPSGSVHSSYKLHGTVTGRLASSDPVNLQNIVRNDDIKNQFRARFLYWLLSVDLSQAELRVLAVLSGDKALMKIFQLAESIHKVVARRFYGPNYNEDQYQLAKSVTFGIVYGRDAFSIAEEYQIPVKDAQGYIDSWFGQFPDAKKFIQRCRMAPVNGVTLTTPWGRKRRFGVVGPQRFKAAGNEAANFPEQSIASDITLEAFYTTGPQLRKWGLFHRNIVHDDIIEETPHSGGEDLVRSATSLIGNTMKEVAWKRGLRTVPFESEWKIGTWWGQLTKASNLPIDFFQKVQYNNNSGNLQDERRSLVLPDPRVLADIQYMEQQAANAA